MTGTVSLSPVNSQILNTERIGQTGHPILILHGWGQSIVTMRQLGELIGNYQQVHLIDLPGFGKSPKPDEDWDSIGYAACIKKYMDDNHIAKADVLGHSFGGKVASRLASRYPDSVRGLILVDSSGLKRQLTGKKKLRTEYVRTLSKLVKWSDKTFKTKLFADWFAPKFGSRDYQNAGPLKNILVKTVNEDTTSDVKKITAPTFILWGELDDETPVEMAERLNQLIPNSRLLVMPRKDHYPFLGDGLHLSGKYIMDFLNSLDPSASTDSGAV